jgi:hypothetical protein
VSGFAGRFGERERIVRCELDSFHLHQRGLEQCGTHEVTIRMEEATSGVVMDHTRLLNNRPHVVF